MQEEPNGFYDDDGNKLNPDLIAKPSLCVSCAKDGDPTEDILCTLSRFDQQEGEEFVCYAYESKDVPEEE